MKVVPLVAYDELGFFEVTDAGLLDAIAGHGDALAQAAGADNGSCFNEFCQNELCIRYGNENVICTDIPDPPRPPQGPNVWCPRPDFACGPLTTC